DNYVIFATSGHLQELKKSGVYNLGVNLESFEPTYEVIPGKENLITTDPDREGEAIAQEVVLLLELSPEQYHRLLFYEITPRNINEALSKPLEVNSNLVEAQVSRQVLDRMIGFCLSTILRKKLQAVSAGRVQSVVLKLIVEREFLIKSYEKKKVYIICGTCQVKEKKAILKQINDSGELIIYKNKNEAEEVKNKLGTIFQLVNKKEEQKFIFPKQPLITSLLLFEAKSQLGFSKKEKKSNVQDAHESIHPTYLEYHPEEIKISLTEEEYQLYRLIFNHTLASLMSPAKVNKITYTFSNNNYLFATSERICQFAGFLICSLEIYLSTYNVKLKSELVNFSQLEAKKIEVQEYTENKPVRYNEGSIVQELEKLGIGRPSTYNTFGRILLKRNYAEQDKKGHFIPTELGISVNKWLQEKFGSLINENYTAALESELDKISQGNNDYYHFIKNFWENFSLSLKKLPQLVNLASENKLKYLAIADYYPYEIVKFFKQCKEKEIKPIWGIKVFFREKSEEKKYSATIYPKNNKGYKEVMQKLFAPDSPVDRTFSLDFLLSSLTLRKDKEEKYQKTLEKELKIIEKFNYVDYLLIFSDAVNHLKKKNIIVGPGRGSAASSLITYLLGITSIDPLQHNLFFERFLNEKRKTLPDIDLDVEDQEEIFNYLQQKYPKKQKNFLLALFEEESFSQLGFKKYDFLSLKETLKLLNNFLITGIFQLDTSSSRILFNKFRPQNFAELILFLALNRPGTKKKVEEISQKKLAKSNSIFTSSAIKAILSETYDSIIFEEQMSQIFSLVYDCSFADAEIKRRELKEKGLEKDFLSKAGGKMSSYESKLIYHQITATVGYTFNKSHAVAYGYLTYYLAYLKANFFSELIVYLLNKGKEKSLSYLQEAFFYNFQIKAPDINYSELN
ncbi:5646_t:CDS:2, partial [Funneliformis geosporum]